VFIGAAEIMEDQQGGSFDRATCPIWLQFLDERGCNIGHSFYFSAFTGVSKCFGGTANRKLKNISVATAGTNGGQLGDEVVQARAEMVDDLTDHYGKSRRNFRLAEGCKHVLARLDIALSDNAIVVTKKADNFKIQIVDVLVGPT
jgi:hypothetical protein